MDMFFFSIGLTYDVIFVYSISLLDMTPSWKIHLRTKKEVAQ